MLKSSSLSARYLVCAAATLFCTTGTPLVAQRSTSTSFIVIVNAANSASTVSKKQLADIFLKRTTRWSSNTTIAPVDQARASRARELFSKAIHDRSTSAIEAYWQQQIFSGKDVPPVTKENDAEVLAYVRARPNAIGYVTAGTPLGDNVKAVTVTE